MSANGWQSRSVEDKNGQGWWSDPQEVIRFARILVDADQLGGCQHTVISFFEAPWNWNNEYRMWCTAGRPRNGYPAASFDALCIRFNAEITDDHADEYVSAFRWLTWSAT